MKRNIIIILIFEDHELRLAAGVAEAVVPMLGRVAIGWIFFCTRLFFGNNYVLLTKNLNPDLLGLMDIFKFGLLTASFRLVYIQCWMGSFSFLISGNPDARQSEKALF